MILRDKSGNEYSAHFRHVCVPLTLTQSWGRRDTVGKWSTECTFHFGRCKRGRDADGRLMKCSALGRTDTGYANCSVKDDFRKVTGRKLALSRAMAYTRREIRREIWEDYFKQRPGDRK